jgi:hypothetical protein
MRATTMHPEFVEFVPENLSEGVLYVSIPYATAAHLCCCGCRNEVVTPLTPTDWSLKFDGETVSLKPSIGNWNFECQSHYWITHNEVRWAPQWSRDQIDAGRESDRRRKAARFHEQEVVAQQSPATTSVRATGDRRILSRLMRGRSRR